MARPHHEKMTDDRSWSWWVEWIEENRDDNFAAAKGDIIPANPLPHELQIGRSGVPEKRECEHIAAQHEKDNDGGIAVRD
jgi:hypothetical protein